ncbi:MAG TPA: type II toxin-antitoxin system prevent-host-death family antitoxin [Burkholderiales bacterium]|nr:type II toxin-antitoxin system prevent-host-death family antitoxin [Burkholderiales bacterium]
MKPTVEKKYSIAQARQKLSTIVREAERAGAVRITRSGQVVARLISEHEFQRLARRKPRIDWGTMLIDMRGFKFDREEANAR